MFLLFDELLFLKFCFGSTPALHKDAASKMCCLLGEEVDWIMRFGEMFKVEILLVNAFAKSVFY